MIITQGIIICTTVKQPPTHPGKGSLRGRAPQDSQVGGVGGGLQNAGGGTLPHTKLSVQLIDFSLNTFLEKYVASKSDPGMWGGIHKSGNPSNPQGLWPEQSDNSQNTLVLMIITKGMSICTTVKQPPTPTFLCRTFVYQPFFQLIDLSSSQ